MPWQPHHPNPSSTAPCFKCGGTDHWARNCLENNTQSNLIDLDEEGLDNKYTYEPKDPVGELKACINAMTAKEKGWLADEMGVGEDFPMAWSGWPWSSKVAIRMCTYQLGNLWQYNSMFTQLQKGLNSLLS
jgi:hypothetical protein